MALIIRKCTISEIDAAPNIKALLDEYAIESCIAGLPHPSAHMGIYRHLETIGAIHVIGAFANNVLIGFIVVLSPVLPHYSERVAIAESFFVAKEYRKTGAGLKILRDAENHAKEIGSCGLLVSAPFRGNLTEVLPHIGYAETNRVFFRGFANE